MILETNGISFELKLSDLNVSFKLPIKNKKVGSNTSSSETINQGTKPKEISVSGIVKYEDEENLKELIKKAEAVNDDETRTVYTVTDKTANVGDVREVIFNNDFNVKKMAKFEAWNVDFTLLQYNSVAEKKEIRAAPKVEPVADSTTGETITTSSNADIAAAKEQNGFVWDMLQSLEKLLAPDNENN